MRERERLEYIPSGLSLLPPMVDHTSIVFPKPSDWQAFERACRVLFACIWDDSSVQLHGRAGQRQHGVDIYGHTDGGKGDLHGVQCKSKTADSSDVVTETELKAEAEKAKSFVPPLRKFIIATTAPNDVAIQKVARELTEEHKKTGLFEVEVWGWENLQTHISQYSATIRAFHPDATLFSDEFRADLKEHFARSHNDQAATHQKLDILLAEVTQLKARVPETSAQDTSSAAVEAAVDKVHHESIDQFRDLLRAGQPRTAHALLLQMKNKIWDKASPRVRFRLLTNLGACQLTLGERGEAAELFLSAFEYAPRDKTALSNRILARLLKHDMKGAREAANDALIQYPLEPVIVTQAVSTFDNEEELRVLLSSLPTSTLDAPDVGLAISEFYRKAGLPDQQRQWIERAYQNDAKKFDEVQNAYALTLLSPLTENKAFPVGAPVSEQSKADLRLATSLLEALWEKARKSEAVGDDVGTAVNLANAYRLAGNLDGARKIVAQATSVAPEDPALRHIRSYIHFYDGNWAACVADIEKLPRAEDTGLMLGVALSRMGRARDALNITDELIKHTSNDDFRKVASLLHAEILADTKDFTTSICELEKLLAGCPYDPEVSAVLAQLKAKTKKPEEAKAILRNAALHLPKAASVSERYQLAVEFHRLDEHDRATDLLAGQLDLTRDTEPLRLLLAASIDGDRRETAKEIFEHVQIHQENARFYARAKASFCLRTGALEEALVALDKLLEGDPTNSNLEFHRLSVLHRLGKTDEVRRRIEGLASHSSSRDAISIAAIMDLYGYGDRALALAYDTLRANPHDPVIHAAFYQLVLTGRSAKECIPETPVVAIDTAFTVKGPSEEKGYTYVIVDVDKPLFAQGELTPDHPVAQRALGRRVGDLVEILPGRNPPDLRSITEIKHKFVHALHEGLENFEHAFPTDTSFERVPIHDGDDGLNSVFERVRQRSEWLNAIGQQYAQRNIPLGTVALLLNGTAIDGYLALGEINQRVNVCNGNREERATAVATVSRARSHGCIIDANTLYVALRLEILEAIAATCGPIHVAQATVDAYQKLIYDAEERLNSSMSLRYHEGQFFREERDASETQKWIDVFKLDLSRIRQICGVVPAEGEIPGRPSFGRVLDQSSLNTLLAAKSHNLVLVSEDYAFRVIARDVGHLRSTWLQPILMVARDEKRIPQANYSKALERLITGRHEFTSVSARDLHEIARSYQWSVSPQLKAAIATLGTPRSDMGSSVSVAAGFLAAIWKRRTLLRNLVEEDFLSAEQATAITFAVIEALTSNRLSDTREIVDRVWIATKQRLNDVREIQSALLLWLRGHFLAPFDR